MSLLIISLNIKIPVMPEENLNQRLGFLVSDASRLMRRDFDRRARTIGLTRSQWSVLSHLSRCEGIKQAGLADILEVTPITLARLIDRLEADGWVERRSHPCDRRARTLYLTEKARPVLAQLRELGQETRERALTGLTEDERDQLVALLARVRCNLSDRDAGELRDTTKAKDHE